MTTPGTRNRASQPDRHTLGKANKMNAPANAHIFANSPLTDADVAADFSAKTSAARERLQAIVDRGLAQTGPLIQRIMTEVPQDRVSPAKRFQFKVDENGAVELETGDKAPLDLHPHAFGQVLERAGIPAPYAAKLAVAGEDNTWRRGLLEHALREHYGNDGARYLVRTVGSQVRGVLSDRFRRLDSRPLLDAFVGACGELGAVPYQGVASDVRSSVRAIVPQVLEPVPGEAMVLGLAWNNSDYGAGVYGISAFVLRLVCLNGLVGESALRQVHLGRKLSEDFTFSNETLELDTKTMVSATRDIVRGHLSPASIEKRLDAVKQAHATETSFAGAWQKAGKGLSKVDQKAVQDAFESEDTVMLPEGKTVWRFSNALSWVAGQTNNPDRKIDLQRAAGVAIGA